MKPNKNTSINGFVANRLPPPRILLMIKDRQNLRLLKELLQKEYQVVIWKSEDELLEQSIDLVLVDDYFLHNFENTLQEIRNREKPVYLPILLLTSQSNNSFLYKQLQAIVTDLIRTPVTKVLLRTRIESMLHIRRLSLESDQRYHELAEKSPVGICILHSQNIVYANPAFMGLCGEVHQDIFMMPFLKFVYKSDKYRVKRLFRNNQNNKMEELRILNGNDIRWVEASFTNIIYKDKESILIMVLDITEKKRTEEEIKYLIFHDKLTGLYNRNFFEEEINRLDTKRQLPLSIIMGDVNGLKLVNDAFGHQTGDLLLKRIGNIIKKVCRKEDIIARWGGDEFLILLPKTPYEVGEKICNRIREACIQAQNKPIQLSMAIGIATKDKPDVEVKDTLKKAEDRMYKNKLVHNESTRNSIIASLENTLMEKSHETNDHAERMNKLAIQFGNKLKLSTSILDELKLLTKLHDIGKVSIPEQILKKPGKLTDEEYEKIKEHPESGYRIVIAVPELSPVAEAILSHHEHWDGSGYPRGLMKENIPYTARIISIIDSYDVMTHKRSYKEAVTEEKALEEIKNCAGSQFDPVLAEVFIDMMCNDN